MVYSEWQGPPSDFGWVRCHGCEREFDDRGLGDHEEDCPGVCVREECGWHVRSKVTLESVPSLSSAGAGAGVPEEIPEHLREWLDSMVEDCKAVMRERGRKYGPGNIAEWGELGVLVRLSDKMARLRTMQQSGVADFSDESVEDTYIDIINYGIIALAWRRGLWPGSKKTIENS